MTKKDRCQNADCAIRLEYGNMMAATIGDQGFTPQTLAGSRKQCQEAQKRMRQMRDRGQMAWMDLPYQTETVDAIKEFQSLVEGEFDTMVVIGIGGSALGSQALNTALCHPYFDLLPKKSRGKRMRIFVSDNVDPERLLGLLSVLDLKKTLFNVVTKSGTTPETLSQFLLVQSLLQKELGAAGHKKHLIVTTDPKKGLIRKIARENGYKSFPVPEGISGRFSVLSPVGLLSAALSGVDIDLLLEGARRMDARLQEPDHLKNPAYLSALFQYLADTRQGRNILVMMSYTQRLHGLANWFRQLWAESIAKRVSRAGDVVHSGSTPILALGATDQHSQVQLYTEGPQDKVVMMLGVDHYHVAGDLPKTKKPLPELAYLNGASLEELLQTERIATTFALRQARRPNMTLMLPEINPCTIGQLIYLLEVQVAFAAELYNINAYDQPGVEPGQKATLAMLGQKGYEALRKEIERDLEEQDSSTVC